MSFMSRKFILDEPGLNIMRPGDADVYRDLGTALSVGGSLIGGLMSSKASSNAADTQAASADAATAESRRQYDLTRSDALDQYGRSRADNAPFLATGTSANQRLSYLLGLNTSPAGKASAPASDAPSGWSKISGADYQNLITARGPGNGGYDEAYVAPDPSNPGTQAIYLPSKYVPAGFSSTLNKSTQALNEEDAAAMTAAKADPAYGSLTRRFTADDLNSDPVYQSGLKFGLDEGTKGINARAIASGGYDSGATLKALTQFGNDYGSQKAGDSYNRFTADQGNTYNKLAGVSGTGQVAVNTNAGAGQNMVNTVAGAGANASNNISNNITSAGNARAAGIVGGSQAWGSAAQGINGAVNNYQSQQTLQALLRRGGGGGYTGVGINGGYPNDGWTGY